jgi:hypothetical protein
VSYVVGIETWRGGKTTVLVRGDGHVAVTNRLDDKERTYVAELPEARLKDLLHSLVQNKFTEQHSARATGSPDEARMTLRFRAPDLGVDSASELWDNERWENPPLKAIVARFQALMSEVSKGAISY